MNAYLFICGYAHTYNIIRKHEKSKENSCKNDGRAAEKTNHTKNTEKAHKIRKKRLTPKTAFVEKAM
ncbi:hypothetical protein DWW86_00180 [Ruminococcus sp. AF17-22AC]|nr:hypothetical protein DWW86_00180 [Ruminococcus sp. AF17-22AC]